MRVAVWVLIAAFMAIGSGVQAAPVAPAEPWGMRPRDPIDLPAKEFFTSRLWAPMASLGEAKGLALADCKKAVDFSKAPYKILRAQQRISGPEMLLTGPKGEEARVTKISDDTILVEWQLGPRAYVACPKTGDAAQPKTDPQKPKDESDRKESGAPELPTPQQAPEQAPQGGMPGESGTATQPPSLPREEPSSTPPPVPKSQDTRPPLQPEPYPLPPVVAPPAQPPAQAIPPKTTAPVPVPPQPAKPSTGKPATPKERGDGPLSELPDEKPFDPSAPGTNAQAPAPAVSPPPASPPPVQTQPAPSATPPPATPAPVAPLKEPAGPPSKGVPFVL